MNFGKIKNLARAFVAEAKKGVVSDTEIESIINFAAFEVASRSICLNKNEKFDSVADTAEYNLTDTLSRYIVPDKSGLWYRTSTSTNYRQLIPTTIKQLDEEKPNWRDVDSGDPTHYAIDGDKLIVTPAPDSAITDAFWMYFGAAPIEMSSDDDYPFGGTSEIHRLKGLQMAIIKYSEIGLTKAINGGIDNFRLKENEYNREIVKQVTLLKRRKDISSYRETKMSFGRKNDSF